MGNAVLYCQLFHKLIAFDNHMRLQRMECSWWLRHHLTIQGLGHVEMNNIEALEGFPSKDDI